MDQNENQNQVNAPEAGIPEATPTPQEPEKGGSGALAGIIIIVIILAIGGYYFWKKADVEKPEVKTEAQVEEAYMKVGEQAPTEADLLTQSSSDEVADIEADLDTTKLDNLDAEIDAIESDLNLDLNI